MFQEVSTRSGRSQKHCNIPETKFCLVSFVYVLMNNLKKIISGFTVALAMCSCDKESSVPQFPDQWQDPNPVVTEKRAFIWIEGNANFKDYGDSKENIACDMAKIADCGFTDIVVDVRPAGAGGDVLYKTDKCPVFDKLRYLHTNRR